MADANVSENLKQMDIAADEKAWNIYVQLSITTTTASVYYIKCCGIVVQNDCRFVHAATVQDVRFQ